MGKPYRMRMADRVHACAVSVPREQTIADRQVMLRQMATIEEAAMCAPRFIVDSVYSLLRRRGGLMPWSKCPWPVPPYPKVWMEYYTDSPGWAHSHIGAYLDTSNRKQLLAERASHPEQWKSVPIDYLDEIHSITSVHMSAITRPRRSTQPEAHTLIGSLVYDVSVDGQFSNSHWQLHNPTLAEVNEECIRHGHDSFVCDCAAAFVYASSLLNCPGVSQVAVPPGPKHVRKNVQKKTGKPLLSYKTLCIDAFRKKLSKNPTPEEINKQIRLHMRRGNIANYTAEKPHVSGYVGPMWRASCVVGNRKNGAVVKDYRVTT
jgi:hypothetical protein